MTPPTIKLYTRRDGSVGEVGADPLVTWILDTYTEPRDSLFPCEACGEDIEEWELWTCLDGGEAAHITCVEIWANRYSKDGSVTHA